jgi:hypothetical protein
LRIIGLGMTLNYPEITVNVEEIFTYQIIQFYNSKDVNINHEFCSESTLPP